MNTNGREPNALIHESSPYLLQHAYNPVKWYPWGDEALAKAKSEGKMMIISIGYAACHWCHVMEAESFEDEEVAKLMNDHFVCIKVDREERPDVDDIYMTACQLINGSGGWPLNAIATSEAHPFWAGTYFPKEKWKEILQQFVKFKAESPDKLQNAADQLVSGIVDSESDFHIDPNLLEDDLDPEILTRIADYFKSNADPVNGGKRGAPKFPMPTNLEFLMTYYGIVKDQKILNHINLTLDKMARGGIYDQVGGGFSRYATDSVWLVPHFEKMLYDNAQLLSIYSQAFKLTKKPLYEKVINEIVVYLQEEMLLKGGGFYSSLDADSEGEEGKYYVWKEEEVNALFSDQNEATIFKDYFNITFQGNFEGNRNILSANKSFSTEKYSISDEELSGIIDGALKKLKKKRSERIKPRLDDKTLTAWNALTITGLIDAYQATGKKAYLEMAVKAYHFVDSNMKNNQGLYRSYKEGKSSINGFLDDYATYIQSLILLYETTLEKHYLVEAKRLTAYTIANFYDAESSMFFYTSKENTPLLARKKEIADNVIPSSNSMMARNLFALGTLLYDEEYREKARKMGLQMLDQILSSKQPEFYGNWCSLIAELTYEPYEVVIVGKDALNKLSAIQKEYHANVYFSGGQEKQLFDQQVSKLVEGSTMIYVCQNKTCKMPTDQVDIALHLMKWK